MTGLRTHLSRFGRRYTQLILAVLCNLNIGGFFKGRIYNGKSKGLCAPGLNCYSCPGAVTSCPLGSLQTAIGGRISGMLMYVVGTLILLGLLFGRVICGFFCPFGLVQDLLYKLPFPKVKKSRFTKALSYLKYVILVVFVVGIPLRYAIPGFCRFLCPAGTLEAGIPLVMTDSRLLRHAGRIFSWKCGVLLLLIVICSVCYRAFCRFLCPLGAIYSLFNPVSFFGISCDRDKCTGCGACIRACRMDIKRPGDGECIACGECRSICPEGAIGCRRFGIKTGQSVPKERDGVKSAGKT